MHDRPAVDRLLVRDLTGILMRFDILYVFLPAFRADLIFLLQNSQVTEDHVFFQLCPFKLIYADVGCKNWQIFPTLEYFLEVAANLFSFQ